MSSDVAAVEKVLQVYFDGLYEGDTKKLGEAFHSASHLYAAGGDGTASDWPRGEWFKMVESRPSGKAKGSARADRIVSIDFSGPSTAIAKVECAALLHRLPDLAEGRWPLADHLQDLPHGDEGRVRPSHPSLLAVLVTEGGAS